VSIDLPIEFPSEAEQLRARGEAARRLTPEQRLQAVADLLAAAEVLAAAGGHSLAESPYEKHCEQQWRDRMKEFIDRHVSPE
jgi:hypothetical protein